ncbi:tetratricopeptide repeat protein [Bradyrhizobium sp. DASA03007]|uniref:tetratricopeptide repeat protein n=1 Tax=unclassified Bradyrhizobium TaxID=2631580 RepID=UPI003F6FB3D3
MGLFPEAQAAYRQLLQLAPNQFIALHMLGTLESDAKNYQQAEILLSRAVAVDPRSAEAHMSLGVDRLFVLGPRRDSFRGSASVCGDHCRPAVLRDAGTTAGRDCSRANAGALERLRHIRCLQPHQQDFG